MRFVLASLAVLILAGVCCACPVQTFAAPAYAPVVGVQQAFVAPVYGVQSFGVGYTAPAFSLGYSQQFQFRQRAVGFSAPFLDVRQRSRVVRERTVIRERVQAPVIQQEFRQDIRIRQRSVIGGY